MGIQLVSGSTKISTMESDLINHLFSYSHPNKVRIQISQGNKSGRGRKDESMNNIIL